MKTINEQVKEDFLKEWYDSDNRRVMITHLDCNDGVGSAVIAMSMVKPLNLDIDIYYVDYNKYDFDEILNVTKDSVVLIADFSFLLPEYEKIANVAKSVVTIDHHKTPYHSPVAELENTHFDMSKSGALLTWEFFRSDEAPWLIKYISDRDLYSFEYGIKTKAVFSGLCDLPKNDVDYVLPYLDDNMLDELIANNIDEVKKYEDMCANEASKVEVYYIWDTKFHGLNTNAKASDILNMASKNTGTPALSYYIKDGMINFSLRNATKDVDVSKVAELFGGGGHEQAAGFSISLTEIDLPKFLIEKQITIKV